MELLGKKVVLKSFKEDDLRDYYKWYTEETEWQKWDAPWIKREFDKESIKEYRTENSKKNPKMTFEIYTCNNEHIGWVNAYYIDDKYIPSEEQTKKIAIGLDIPNELNRGNGVGTEALELFIDNFRKAKIEEIYIQTWSGNARMINVAKKLGFGEINRYVGKRIVNDKKFDALTFFKKL